MEGIKIIDQNYKARDKNNDKEYDYENATTLRSISKDKS